MSPSPIVSDGETPPLQYRRYIAPTSTNGAQK